MNRIWGLVRKLKQGFSQDRGERVFPIQLVFRKKTNSVILARTQEYLLNLFILMCYSVISLFKLISTVIGTESFEQ